MHSKLKEIIEEKKEEIRQLKNKKFTFLNLPEKDFYKAISGNNISLIAEIKYASPSAGKIREGISAKRLARIYEKEGASAISVLTERKFFKGDIGFIPEIKEEVGIPILRKDFILDPIQLEEAKAYGADAVLIIVRILSDEMLERLIRESKDMGLAPVVEVHTEEDIKRALDAGADIIGINNRDLSTFRVDIDTTIRLSKFIPARCLLISESGIYSAEDILRLRVVGVDAVLVGTSIMKSDDINSKVRELVKAGRYGQV